jgi:hypothetical protein
MVGCYLNLRPSGVEILVGGPGLDHSGCSRWMCGWQMELLLDFLVCGLGDLLFDLH